ncbi:MAG: orotate phosphoribosyltransferase [Bacteroidales bacterium]|nr:orotate phosphoribosyltransferase [Bacteroidales bacterium]
MNNTEQLIAEKLVQIQAIKLQPKQPFTWASGWKSPIYCDNRLTLSYPEVRAVIAQAFVDKIKQLYPHVEYIAGVATGAIAHGLLVAEKMKLPFVYVRSSAKEHGMGNQIEGFLPEGKNVVVIEDLISTGGSSLKAVQSLRDAGANVLGMLAIFTYDFSVAKENFDKSNVNVETLSNYHALIDYALSVNYIENESVETLKQWRENPAEWTI